MVLATDMIPRNQTTNVQESKQDSPNRGYDGNLLRASLGSLPNGRHRCPCAILHLDFDGTEAQPAGGDGRF